MFSGTGEQDSLTDESQGQPGVRIKREHNSNERPSDLWVSHSDKEGLMERQAADPGAPWLGIITSVTEMNIR